MPLLVVDLIGEVCLLQEYTSCGSSGLFLWFGVIINRAPFHSQESLFV